MKINLIRLDQEELVSRCQALIHIARLSSATKDLRESCKCSLVVKLKASSQGSFVAAFIQSEAEELLSTI